MSKIIGENMRTTSNFGLLKKSLLLICIFIFSGISTYASVNFLSGIDVKQTNDNNHSVLLKLNNSVKIQKVSNSKDNLTLTLASTMPSDSIDIVYDNTDDLQNVVVQKKNADNTVIAIQGKNIENAKIYVNDISSGITKEYKDSMLNNLLFLANDNVSTTLAILSLLILLMFAHKPTNKKKNSNKNITISNHVKNYQTINTLKTQNIKQSRRVPSINYNVNKIYENRYATKPQDFVINESERKERIRKVG